MWAFLYCRERILFYSTGTYSITSLQHVCKLEILLNLIGSLGFFNRYIHTKAGSSGKISHNFRHEFSSFPLLEIFVRIKTFSLNIPTYLHSWKCFSYFFAMKSKNAYNMISIIRKTCVLRCEILFQILNSILPNFTYNNFYF